MASLRNSVVRAVGVIAQMLRDRGEDASGLEGIDDAGVRARVDNSSIARFDAGGRDVIFFLEKAKKSDIARAASNTAEDRLDDPIVVVAGPSRTSVQTNMLSSFFGTGLELFSLTSLAFNISRHMFVPKHEIVPREDVPKLLERLMVSDPSLLPYIENADPMAKYIRARRGDVVRVTRLCPTSGTQIAYRFCV